MEGNHQVDHPSKRAAREVGPQRSDSGFGSLASGDSEQPMIASGSLGLLSQAEFVASARFTEDVIMGVVTCLILY